MTGAVAGAISSAVYGGNWGNNMLEGLQGGLIGTAVGMVTGAIVEAGQKVIAGMKVTIEIIRELVKRPLEVMQAVLADMMYGPLDTITIWGADRYDQGIRWRKINVKAFRLTELTGNSYTLSSTEIHVSRDTIDAIKNYSYTATKDNPAYDDLRNEYFESIPSTGRGTGLERHIAHEIGHTCQGLDLGIFYLPLVAPVTIFKSNQYLNYFERDASRRGLYGGIAE